MKNAICFCLVLYLMVGVFIILAVQHKKSEDKLRSVPSYVSPPEHTEPMQAIYDYSKSHKVSCDVYSHHDDDNLFGAYNCTGAEVVNGVDASHTCDIDYKCTDGKVLTEIL